MPKVLEDCVKEVQEKIDRGELPKDSSAWAICISRLRESGKIKKVPGKNEYKVPKESIK